MINLEDESAGKEAQQETSDDALEKSTEKPPERTPEELARLVKEYESKLGQQGQELGELKKQLFYLQEEQRRRDYELSQKQQITEPPPTAEEVDEFDWTRPGKSISEIARKELMRELERREKARQAYEIQMYQEYARKNYEAGWRKANEKNPALFDGIQNEVQNLIYQSFVQGKLGADEIGDERIWERTAQLLWLEKGNVDKLIPKKIEPMRPVGGGNLPDQVKAGIREGPIIDFDEKSREIMKAFNLDEEKAKKLIEAERQGRGR